MAVKTFLTCLLTFALSLFTNVDNSSITERGNKHSSSPSHSRRDTLNEELKGRTINASGRWGRGKHSKVNRLRASNFSWEDMNLKDPLSDRFCIYAAVSWKQSWGSVLMLRGKGHVVSSTGHAQSIIGVSHSTLLHTSFPCLDSHQSYDNKNTRKCTKQNVFWGISLKGFLN